MQQQQRGATLEQRRADVDDTAWGIREERALCELRDHREGSALLFSSLFFNGKEYFSMLFLTVAWPLR